MKQRNAARLGRDISEIGFGAWQIGGAWGEVTEADAIAALGTVKSLKGDPFVSGLPDLVVAPLLASADLT